MNYLDWDDEEQKTPVRLPGPTPTEIEVCNRIIHNEIGPIDSQEEEEQAIALIYALINLSERTTISISKLLTDYDIPSETCFCTKNVMFSDGRTALLSTLNPCEDDYSGLLTEIFSGIIKDPLYGAYRFFNYLEDTNPESHRARWGLEKNDDVKTGIIYGKFEYDPIPFLKARANGVAEDNHLDHWEKQKSLMV